MATEDSQFYTARGYALLNQDDSILTPSMEDYLEMAYRLGNEKGYTRISDLAEALNVQPPSASKMVQKLAEGGYIIYERYGVIEFTKKGLETGAYLLQRHRAIEEFLQVLGVKDNILADTEKIEHNISAETHRQITIFLRFMRESPEYKLALEKYQIKLAQKNL